MHFYGHSKGLKTGSYYLRTKPKAKSQQFTIDPEFAKKKLRCAENKFRFGFIYRFLGFRFGFISIVYETLSY
jgi:hypothetical protein